ncbi:7-carboxy-7-deazaguanine synthase QueE [Candidatus Latescibacterota bacterium]
MKITEIFSSLQGESTLQGLPCVFVRVSGCNLDCRYCDTQYARKGGTDMTVKEIVKKADYFGLKYVCITGGEPLIQKETPKLAEEFINRGWKVSIETNGSLDASMLHEHVIRVIDIKCPGSGESGKTIAGNILNRRASDEFKFVITDRADFDYAVAFIRENDLTDAGNVLFSPAYNILDPKKLSAWILKDMPEVRLNLQLHKYIWHDSDERNIIH